jgi:hypothetical protein
MRAWLLGLLCIVPMMAGASAPWPGISWPDVGGGTTVDNYVIGTWYVNDGALWTFTAVGDTCIKSRGATAIAVCEAYDEVSIPFSSPNGLNIVDLTCTVDPSTWDNSSEWVELEVNIHVPASDGGDKYGTPTTIVTRLLSDGDAPKVFSSGDATYTSSVTAGYLTLQTRPDENQWNSNGTDDFVQAICSVEVN